ncbi:hypothetical protein ACU4EZ_25765 [Klebsiella pneumoniae]|uniref:hypothetical protein n=1 Tax=Klebsiella pneumoniae TaxID=573 RepID=UPI0021679665|nr:hypothetical protein [Klebsiella pneumoniae]MCS4445196.1 hypothetical protein [Klebsiella pneumoniae]
MDKSTLLLEKLRERTQSSLASGGDGFVLASMLVFDVGLNSRTIRKILDVAVNTGTIEKRERGAGRAHKYRTNLQI